MALTRKMLKAMGVEDEKADEIIEAHVETVDGIKKERDRYKADAEQLPAVQKKLEEAESKADGSASDEYKAKYDEEHKAFSEYRAEVEKANATREKKAAYRKLLEAAGVDPKRLEYSPHTRG